jgi:adenylate cyclase
VSQLTLKKLIFRKKDARVMVDHLIQAVGSPITILDAEGQFLLGDDHQTSGGRYPIQLEGETLGWVLGGEQAAAVAALLAQLVLKEFEKKALAGELLDKYRELNILYDLSEKMAACAEFKAMAQLAIDEAGRLIDASGGAVMFLVEDSQELKTIATLNQTRGSTSSLRLGEGIVGRVAQTGKAELVNDVWSDPGFIAGDSDISSLICVPLKAKQQVVGVVTVFHEQPTTYTAENLKLLTALASQAAPMLEHAFVYETKLKEARAREDRLEQQLLEFRIGLDETKQLLHRTLDITPPFDFLTFGQKEWLVDRVQPAS